MPEYTENYGLTLPLKTENYDLDHMTNSMKIIDTELKRVDDKIQEVEQDLTQHKLDYVEDMSNVNAQLAEMATDITQDPETDLLYLTNKDGERIGNGVVVRGGEGKSAYDIAVENGFIGTEAEWLASLEGKDGKDGVDGLPGQDGKSAYEIWLSQGNSGTELDFINSLKGQDGVDGKSLEFNWNGTQLGIKQEGESQYQYVNLQGPKGDTPIKGVDYWTDADKAEIIQSVVDAIKNGGLIGFVDADNTIILKGTLADDVYIIKYEMEDGSVIEIGELVLIEPEEPEEPAYTNLLPLATDAAGNDFVGPNGEDGYKYGYRIRSSTGQEEALNNEYCTGYMPVTRDDIIRIKNITLRTDNPSYNMLVCYDSNYNHVFAISINNFDVNDEGVYTGSMKAFTAIDTIRFFRFCTGEISDETIVTVNEEIV